MRYQAALRSDTDFVEPANVGGGFVWGAHYRQTGDLEAIGRGGLVSRAFACVAAAPRRLFGGGDFLLRDDCGAAVDEVAQT